MEQRIAAMDIELEIPISAPRARVWHALAHELGAWWRRDFYVGTSVKALVLEPRPGGRLYEDWGEGAGLLWYTVLVVEPGEKLHLAGQLLPEYCGGCAATTVLRLSLEDAPGGTLLRLKDTVMGRISDSLGPNLRDGWKLLFAEGLKPYVESSGSDGSAPT